MRIFIDMDGTIEKLYIPWIKRLNAHYGYDVQPEDVLEWDLGAVYSGLSDKQIMDELLDPTIWDEVEPMEGAAEVMQEFIAQGHELYIVTSSEYQTLPDKMDRLLFKRFPFLSWHQVVITDHKQLLDGDVLIDDGVHNLIGGNYIKILFDATYNRSFDAEGNGMIRARNWDEVRKIVQELDSEWVPSDVMPFT